MEKMNNFLMLDAGNAFGLSRLTNPYFQEHFTFIDQYDLEKADLKDFQCLVINGFVDQEFLVTQKEKIRDFLNMKKIVIFCGNLFCDWLPGGSNFIPKEINSFKDYVVSIAKPHPIFEDVESDDMTFNKGVAGFFARGHHPIPEGAEVLLTLPGNEPITYIDRHSTEGTILVHVGFDLFGNMNNNKTTDRISNQLLKWVHDEVAELQKGSVTA
ncbi:MAG: phosphate starvation-inducible protein PhoH [Bacillus sp. (in: firmicutes)]